MYATEKTLATLAGGASATPATTVSIAASTVGGWSIFKPASSQITNVVQAVKSSAAGTLAGLIYLNNNSAVAGGYIQIFDIATAGGVTLGTTPPTYTIIVPPYGWNDKPWVLGWAFTLGCQVAFTTTVAGNTAAAAPLECGGVFFK